MKRYEVLISGTAQRMLQDHVFFLAGINPSAARNLKETIMKQVRSLALMPERYPYLEPDNRKSSYRKLFVPNWYLILYTVVEDTVYVEYVLDCRQDYGWLR